MKINYILKKILRSIYNYIRNMFKLINRFKTPVNWHNLRRLKPISRVFGFDRGTPIDRVYIEHFLNMNKQYIQGVVCEIADKSGTHCITTDIFDGEIAVDIILEKLPVKENEEARKQFECYLSNNSRFSFRIIWNMFRRRVL